MGGENGAKQDIAQNWAVPGERQCRGKQGGFGGVRVQLQRAKVVPNCHSSIGQCCSDQSFPGKVRLR